MLELINHTPFAAAHNLHADPTGAERITVAVKATFEIPQPGEDAVPAPKQRPVLLSDTYHAEPGRSSLKYPADLVAEKVATDVGLVGTAHSRDGMPVTHLQASVRVGPVEKRVLVTGDRQWQKNGLGRRFKASDPEPFTTMPLVYERAFGGAHDDEIYADNPVGAGLQIDEQQVEGRPLPNLEYLDQRIQRPGDQVPAACFGFVAPMWQGRLKHAGTHDDQWRRQQFPLPPVDFDPRFYNAASQGLVADGFLKGGEPVILANVSKQPLVEFHLPRLRFRVTMPVGKEYFRRQPDIWTVLLEPDQQQFCMVWGTVLDAGRQPGCIEDIHVELTEGGGPWN